MTRVIAVLGGSGGVGASTFAAVLAAQAPGSLLVDVDPSAGGIDVLLGLDPLPGARWSGLRVAGGRLGQDDLLAGLPGWGSCAVLAADVASIDPEALHEVLECAIDGSAFPAVILDLGRGDSAERAMALLHCDLVVALVRADLTGAVAAHAVLDALPELPSGIVVRRGDLAAGEIARMVSAPLLGTLPTMRSPVTLLDPQRLPRALTRVAAGVLAGTAETPAGPAMPRLAPGASLVPA
jgi:secretion/DNA translocation related CpaE-like protein